MLIITISSLCLAMLTCRMIIENRSARLSLNKVKSRQLQYQYMYPHALKWTCNQARLELYCYICTDIGNSIIPLHQRPCGEYSIKHMISVKHKMNISIPLTDFEIVLMQTCLPFQLNLAACLFPWILPWFYLQPLLRSFPKSFPAAESKIQTEHPLYYKY